MNTVVLISFAVSFVPGILLCHFMIPILRKLKFGQNIREEGPEAHKKKSGTPTMGGVAIIIAMMIGAVPFTGIDLNILFVVLATLLFGGIGFLDDMLKIRHHQSEGLTPAQKMGMQVIVTAGIILFIALVSLFFLIRAYRAGKALGIDVRKMKRVITASATFAVLPSVGILLGVIALMLPLTVALRMALRMASCLVCASG